MMSESIGSMGIVILLQVGVVGIVLLLMLMIVLMGKVVVHHLHARTPGSPIDPTMLRLVIEHAENIRRRRACRW